MINEKLSYDNIVIFFNKDLDVSYHEDFLNLDMCIHIKHIKHRENKNISTECVNLIINNCVDTPNIEKYMMDNEIHIDVKCKIKIVNQTKYIPFNTIIQVIGIRLVFDKNIINKNFAGKDIDYSSKYYSKINMRYLFDFEENENSSDVILHLFKKQNIKFLQFIEIFVKYFIIPALFTGFTILVSNFSNVEYIGMFATFVLSDIALLFTLDETGDTTVTEINIGFNILVKIIAGFIRLWVQKNDIDYVEGTYNILLDFFNLITKRMVMLSGDSRNFVYSTSQNQNWDTFSNFFFIDKKDFSSSEYRDLTISRIEIDDINDSLEGLDISNSGNTQKLSFEVLLLVSVLTVFLYSLIIIFISKYKASREEILKNIYRFIHKNNEEIDEKRREKHYKHLYMICSIFEYYNVPSIKDCKKNTKELREIEMQSSCVHISF